MKNFVMRGVMQFGVVETDQPPHPCPPKCADPVVPYDHSGAIGRQNPTPVRPTRENRYDGNSARNSYGATRRPERSNPAANCDAISAIS
jgi:hypothetical protein